MNDDDMKALTAGTEVKSEKIRLLYKAGVERADIARFLEITYQHVQNVLKRSGLLDKTQSSKRDVSVTDEVYTLVVARGGKITLPAQYMKRHDISEGETLICREDDSGLHIMSREAAAAMLQEIAKQRMPGQAALLEALLADHTKIT